MAKETFNPALMDYYTELVSAVLYLGRKPAAGPAIDQMAALLDQLLARSRARARQDGITEERWLAGLYPVVAWIDEQLLNSDWPGRQAWVGRSLQRRHFQTTLAGRDFFIRLEQLAAEDIALREVFDLCLALGFRGQYFHAEDQERLAEIKTKNLEKMGLDLSLRLPEQLFVQTRPTVMPRGVRGYRPDNPVIQVLLWLLPIAAVLGLYLVLRGSLTHPG